MTNETNKTVTISAEPITIPVAQFSRLLRAAVHCEYLMRQKRTNEEVIARMRKELTRYQTHCENAKRTSGAGASAEPQPNTTNADETKTVAGLLAIETEGRVSGGERADFSDVEREHYKRLEEEYVAISNERDELKEKLNAARDASNDFEQRLAEAERCIGDVEHVLYGIEDEIDTVKTVRDIIRAWHEKKEAAK